MKINGIDISVLELAESIVKGVVATIPYAGRVASIYGDWQNKVQVTNIHDIINKITERLQTLEDKVNKDFTNSDAYTALLINVAFKGQNELSDDKRTLYAEFAVACCLKENPQDDYIAYLDIVSRINRSQLTVLIVTDSDGPTIHSWSSGNLKRIDSQLGNGIYTEKELDYLVSLGLVTKVDVVGVGKMLAAIGFQKDIDNFIGRENIYYRTSFGNSLIKFLKPALEKPL